MAELQKIVVLCIVFAFGIFLGLYVIAPEVDAPESAQVDPPSQEIETGPEDTTPVEPVPIPKDPNPPIKIPDEDTEPVACTADAMQCPDGSYVGRTGPNCEFVCPTEESHPGSVVCTDEMKTAEMCTMQYAPVCGFVDVQCVTTPCDPVPETFGNGCVACSQGNVSSYTPGACEA